MTTTVVQTYFRDGNDVVVPASLVGDVYVIFAAGTPTNPTDIAAWHTQSQIAPPPDSRKIYVSTKRVTAPNEPVDMADWGLAVTDAVILCHLRFDFPITDAMLDVDDRTSPGVHFAV